MQIINCSRWEPTVTIKLRNKNLLICELVFDEVVTKRRSQVRSSTEGLQISGFLKYIKQYPISAGQCLLIHQEKKSSCNYQMYLVYWQ